MSSNDKVHVALDDYTPGYYAVYYKGSTNGGTTWSAAQRLSWMSGDSQRPAIAADSTGAVHVVWYWYISGNSDIYYTKGS
jgi:hypothetical protein